MTITPDQVRHNGMTENLGTDVVAVDAQGNVLGRADTRDAAERASPDAVAFFTAKDFEAAPTTAAPAPASADHNDAFDKILAQVDPAVLKDYLPATEAVSDAFLTGTGFTRTTSEGVEHIPAEDVQTPAEPSDPVTITSTTDGAPVENEKPTVDGSAFDHDGDGKVGGSKPKASRQRKPADK